MELSFAGPSLESTRREALRHPASRQLGLGPGEIRTEASLKGLRSLDRSHMVSGPCEARLYIGVRNLSWKRRAARISAPVWTGLTVASSINCSAPNSGRRLRPAILVLVSWGLLALAIWSATVAQACKTTPSQKPQGRLFGCIRCEI